MTRKREPAAKPAPKKSPRKQTTKKPETSEGLHLKRRNNFLAAFRKTGNITRAAEIAVVSRKSHYDWMRDPAYAEAFRDAMEEAADRVEYEIWRRGVEGVEEPVGWYQGTAGGTVRRYSDALLIVTAKALRPAKFRENYALEQRLAALEAAFVELTQAAIANRNGADPVANRLRA